MKIGFFSYLPLEWGGGVSKYFQEVSVGLSRNFKNVRPSIITFDRKTLRFMLFIYWLYFFGGQDTKMKKKGTKKHFIEEASKIEYFTGSISEVKKYLQSFDIIYSTNNLLEVLYLKYFVGYKNLPPIIYGFHIPSYYPITPNLQAKLHNRLYASNIYINALTGAKYLHVLNGLDEKIYKAKFGKDKVTKIYNPFDFDAFEKLALKKEYPLRGSRQKIKILWVGRLTAQKGVADLARLITLINSSVYKGRIIWYIAGDGELKQKILDLEKRWDNVNYLGYLENKYLPSIYKKNHLFISTSSWESFPYNLLEAQSFGLPCIAFDIPGPRDIIENGKNGYLVRNLEGFSDRIKYVLDTKRLEKRNIRRFIRKKFKQKEIYLQLYRLFTR